MSADNEVAILKFKDKFAVGVVRGCPGISTITKYLPRTAVEFNDEFTVFDDELSADVFASKLDEGIETEYGVTLYQMEGMLGGFTAGLVPATLPRDELRFGGDCWL